jgi:hypothetical protein
MLVNNIISKLTWRERIEAEVFIKELSKVDAHKMRNYRFDKFFEHKKLDGVRGHVMQILKSYV